MSIRVSGQLSAGEKGREGGREGGKGGRKGEGEERGKKGGKRDSIGRGGGRSRVRDNGVRMRGREGDSSTGRGGWRQTEYQLSYLGDKYHHMQSKHLNCITVVSQTRTQPHL